MPVVAPTPTIVTEYKKVLLFTLKAKTSGLLTTNPEDFIFVEENNIKQYAKPEDVDLKIDKHTGATYNTNAIQTVTQAEYDALTPVAGTLYFIPEP